MKKRVLFILHYPPPVHGAAMVGQYIQKSTVINNDIRSIYLNLGTSRSINEIGKGGVRKWWRYILLLWNTLTTILTSRPDLVYLTLTSRGSGFYKDALVAMIAKALRVKTVYHFHNKGVKDRQDRVFDNFLYKMVFKNVDVILPSKLLYPDIERYISKTRIYTCANGIPNVVDGSELQANKESRSRFELLFLSNLIESKGIFVLLQACKILKNKGVIFHCTIAGGEGNISEMHLKKKIEGLGLSKEMSYVGKKLGAAKSELFSKADVFVHPTLDDCFPLVLLEAMQFSLPVISTYEGGIPDIVENNKTGFLVQKNNAAELADSIETLYEDLIRSIAMGTLGRKKFEKEFSLTAFETRITSLLLNLSINIKSS